MSVAAGEPIAEPPAVGSPGLVTEEMTLRKRLRRKRPSAPGEKRWLAALFLAPALILLAAVLVYPLIYSVVRSLFSDTASGGVGSFVGLHNYAQIFRDSSTLRSVRNNVLWVVFVPTVITILGLIFAVLAERIRWSTVFKTVLFMPMAISFLASGITFALIYTDAPSRGLANAVTIAVHDTFSPGSHYPGLHPRNSGVLTGSAATGYTTTHPVGPGQPALLPLTGLPLSQPPPNTAQAVRPAAGSGITGVVWNDFRLGGGGTPGAVDPGERGLGGVTVQALQGDHVVASTTTKKNGDFAFSSLHSGSYRLRLPASNFTASYQGISWLGPNLITPAIMIAYLWIYTGFAMVLLAAGMAAIPRDALEAARIDGANEWQVFRRITAPLLAPVLIVVFVTLVINVLKIFDIVFVIQQSAGANAKYADVLAVSLYDNFGTQHYGLASAIGVLLVALVIPAMVSNIRRFRGAR